MLRKRRFRIFVDLPVQGIVLFRAFIYVACCVGCVLIFTFLWMAFNHWPRSTSDLIAEMQVQFAPAMLAVVLLLPIVVMDCVKLTHRIAGPLMRIRRAMKQLADGEPASTIQLRKGDFLGDLVDDLNRVIEQRSSDTA